MLATTGLSKRIHHYDLIITGEGALDTQSSHGKAPSAVATLARKHRIPALALTGRCDLDPAQLRDMGIERVYDFSIRWGLLLADRLHRVAHYHRNGQPDAARAVPLRRTAYRAPRGGAADRPAGPVTPAKIWNGTSRKITTPWVSF